MNPVRRGKHDPMRDQPMQERRRKLGDILIEWGLLRQEQIDRVLEEQSREYKRFGEIVRDLRLVSETDLVRALAEQLGEVLAGAVRRDQRESLLELLEQAGGVLPEKELPALSLPTNLVDIVDVPENVRLLEPHNVAVLIRSHRFASRRTDRGSPHQIHRGWQT